MPPGHTEQPLHTPVLLEAGQTFSPMSSHNYRIEKAEIASAEILTDLEEPYIQLDYQVYGASDAVQAWLYIYS